MKKVQLKPLKKLLHDPALKTLTSPRLSKQLFKSSDIMVDEV
eukprot:CAMPEP_0116870350 /NCGR_PEP_ID=MMETSP0463-20121206/226_1 /TAXON_ID=181622 /ORGANISM="Strombidinopsis sp, Strain SopsisLIS2011" /LENGTH=41 /DNA_ID= /DNA_START= /DNA_END= /DNA_ORIENTATION=